jgi:hypothetical protein
MINNLSSLEELEYVVKDDYFPRQNQLSLILPVQWDESAFALAREILLGLESSGFVITSVSSRTSPICNSWIMTLSSLEGFKCLFDI